MKRTFLTTAPNIESDKINLDNFKTENNGDRTNFKINGELFKKFLDQAERKASARTKNENPITHFSSYKKIPSFKNSAKSPLITQTTQATQATQATIPNLAPNPIKINKISKNCNIIRRIN